MDKLLQDLVACAPVMVCQKNAQPIELVDMYALRWATQLVMTGLRFLMNLVEKHCRNILHVDSQLS